MSGLAQSVFEMSAARKLPSTPEREPTDVVAAKPGASLSELYFDLGSDDEL